MIARTALVLAIAGLAVWTTACVGERPYFRSREAALAHFKENQDSFLEAMRRWEITNPNGDFGYSRWEGNSLSWNGFVIKPEANKYKVNKDGTVLRKAATFEEAASIARVDPARLREWEDLAQRLQIYYISCYGTARPLKERYIEITLRGSETRPYGFIYVPENHAVAYEDLLFESENRPIRPYTKVELIDGRWFYFEGKP
jgi:hypothetical protein